MEDEWNLNCYNSNPINNNSEVLPSAFKRTEEVDLSIKRQRKPLNVDWENGVTVNNNKESEEADINNFFTQMNQD